MITAPQPLELPSGEEITNMTLAEGIELNDQLTIYNHNVADPYIEHLNKKIEEEQRFIDGALKDISYCIDNDFIDPATKMELHALLREMLRAIQT